LTRVLVFGIDHPKERLQGDCQPSGRPLDCQTTAFGPRSQPDPDGKRAAERFYESRDH